jgi:hypothetical protein
MRKTAGLEGGQRTSDERVNKVDKWERNYKGNIVAYFMLFLGICQISNSIKLITYIMPSSGI